MKFSCTMKVCYVLNIFLTLHWGYMLPQILVLLILLEDTLISKASVIVEKKHTPDFLQQLSHWSHRLDIFSHNKILVCTHILHHPDPHECWLPHRVNRVPATVTLVICHLSLFFKARRQLCAAVNGFVRKPYWLDTSIVSPANLVNCYLRNY